MSETMHIQNLFTRIATLNLRPKTRVKYTQASGLPDWEGVITGEIAGTSTSPYYTSQIPNVDQAQTIRIGENVTSIGYEAFAYCSSLTSVTIPDSVTTIGELAFYYCSSLTSVTIGNGVTSIGYRAFLFCSGMTSITIPDSVTNIGRSAFADCSSCMVFDFRQATSVPTLSNVDAFHNTLSNKEIIVPDSLYDSWIASSNWSSSAYNIVNCIVKASQSSLGVLNPTKVRYTQTSGLPDAEFSIVGTIEGQEDDPYYTTQIANVSSAESIWIGPDVTTIGENAFTTCNNLTHITMSNSLTIIGICAFNNCSGLTGILTLPDSVTSIQQEAFRNCNGLTGVSISSISLWCQIIFGHYTANPLYYVHNLYLNGSLITNIAIPNGITSILDYAFCGCSITGITIPESVSSIGTGAFRDCTQIANIAIPNNTTSIGHYAFRGCTSLTGVTIPDGITEINMGTFQDCSSITRLTFGENIQNIKYESFRNCSICTIFDFRKATSVPTLGTPNAFYDTPSNKEIIVPDSLYDSWRVASNWSSSAYNIVNCIVKASQSSLGPLT